ncbi:MAG: Peroxisomal membrane protein PAS20 [Geoglossum simile]|nr:MAG: Peroxisomal membrane protein PAS20 [Geoglossum simile]
MPIATSTALTPTSNPTSINPAASSTPPALPQRPSTLNSVVNRTASNYSPYAASRFGTSNYGMSALGSTMGTYGSAYTSPYSRFGGYGGSMYGGYGGMYGGMGMGGMPGMGVAGDPNDPNSLTNSFSQSTQATFQIIGGVVGAFGGFAQMLESTYMATQSSFFAIVSVAEQFGNLRNTLGSILGIFTLLRWFRTLLAKLTGRPLPADATDLTPSAFAAFEGRAVLPDGSPAPPRPSKKPFLVFMLAVVGLPYLMRKFIKAIALSQEGEEQRRRLAGVGPSGEPLSTNPQQLDPSKLDFCRVLYDFTPEAGVAGVDLDVKKGDLVAVLSKSDPLGNPSEWWRCRARDARVGYLPCTYLEGIQRGEKNGSRSGNATRTGSLTSQVSGVGEVKGKVGDVSVESFMKSGFYS